MSVCVCVLPSCPIIIFCFLVPTQEGLTVLEIAQAHGHLQVCRELERYSPHQTLVPEAEAVPPTSEESENPDEQQLENQSKARASRQAKVKHHLATL